MKIQDESIEELYNENGRNLTEIVQEWINGNIFYSNCNFNKSSIEYKNVSKR